MTRLPVPNKDDLTPEQRAVHDKILSGPRGGVRGPLAIWLHRPDLADRAQKLGIYCRYGSSLPPRLSELAILTTARIWDASFEWETHRPHALSAGVSEDVVNALAEDRTPEFKVEEEELVYLFTRELNLKRSVSDVLFERTMSCLGHDSTVDLVGVLGYYSLISMAIKAFDIPPPS